MRQRPARGATVRTRDLRRGGEQGVDVAPAAGADARRVAHHAVTVDDDRGAIGDPFVREVCAERGCDVPSRMKIDSNGNDTPPRSAAQLACEWRLSTLIPATLVRASVSKRSASASNAGTSELHVGVQSSG